MLNNEGVAQGLFAIRGMLYFAKLFLLFDNMFKLFF
jgi:hypothetical protein